MVDLNLALKVFMFMVVIVVTYLSSSDISGLLTGIPLLFVGCFLNLYATGKITAKDTLKISAVLAVVYNIVILTVNHTYLNWYTSEPSEALRLFFLSVGSYFVIFLPFLLFLEKD